MFTLNDYVEALLMLLDEEKSLAKRKIIIESWFKILKKHHRLLEGKKIINILERKIGERREKANVAVASEGDKTQLAEFFKSKRISIDWEIDPKILGGARITWDNLLIDNTLNSQLTALRKKLRGEK